MIHQKRSNLAQKTGKHGTNSTNQEKREDKTVTKDHITRINHTHNRPDRSNKRSRQEDVQRPLTQNR